jgi:HD-GYP domain-containing protein (c-di-GMP phosphodiesterase class II)
MSMFGHNFFSISFDLVVLDRMMPYDLYVNSSAAEKREKFVRIYPKGDPLYDEDLKIFKKKYFQLYVHESQRDEYLRSLIHLKNVPDNQKTDIIKNSAIVYLDKLFDKNKEFTTEVLSETISGCKTAVESMVEVIKDYDVSKLQNLIGSLSFHDFYTYDHSINVSMYCIALFNAVKPNAPKEEIVMAGLGGMLHDIGKIKITTDIINKPDKLTDEEFGIIKSHPKYGLELLSDSERSNHTDCAGVDFDIIKRIVYEHHENYNGTGYPNQISGESIHLLARITAIADFFDAITTKRTYHEVLSTEDALQVMSKAVGKKIDPYLFEVFTKNVKQLVINGKINKELPEDFDPCQPQNVLPFRTPKPSYKIEGFGKSEKEKAPEYGKIKKAN